MHKLPNMGKAAGMGMQGPPGMGGLGMQGPPGMGMQRPIRALTPLPGKATTASKAGAGPPMSMRPPAQKGGGAVRPFNVADLHLPAPGEKFTPDQRQQFLNRVSQIPSQELDALPEQIKRQIREILS